MNLDPLTYGETPAAQYLVRTLNHFGNPGLNRTVGRRINSTTTAVNDLLQAYYNGHLTAKTVANSLRLMRAEVTAEPPVYTNGLVDKLCKNVRIGSIKHGMRVATIGAKAARVMVNPEMRGVIYQPDSWPNPLVKYVKFTDRQSSTDFVAGAILGNEAKGKQFIPCRPHVPNIPASLLMERSNKRCARLGKPHMDGV